MAEAKKVDRRIQRTRTLLRDALMRLIIRKGYDEITIQDITDEANVARTTFYLHFTDKDELLFGTMRDIYEELYQAIGGEMSKSFYSDDENDCMAEDFRHVQEYSAFYKIMLSERGSAAFLARVRQYLAEAIMDIAFKGVVPEGKDARVPPEMMSYAMAGAQIGVIKWWLDNGMQESPQRVSFMFEQLMKRGLAWGLNLEEEENS
ncbi:MAG: TetR/AcrR family transcriptional regulator [Phototrophicaceae bacterium]